MLSFRKTPAKSGASTAPRAVEAAPKVPPDGSRAQHHDEASRWQATLLALMEEREARARWTNIVFGIGMVLALAAAAGAYWRPVPEPHIMSVDASTGRMERVTVLSDNSVPATEADARYNLEKFVDACESYIPQMIQMQAQTVRWNTGVDSIRDACTSRMQRRIDAYEYNTRVDVEIVSIVLVRPRVATVRFRTLTKNLGTAAAPRIRRFTANIVYVFDNALELPEAVRDQFNPRGFIVREYTVEAERVIDDPEPLPEAEALSGVEAL